MTIINKHNQYIILLLLSLASISCKKDWLNEKPRKELIVPKTIDDFQSILDNTLASGGYNTDQPALDEIGAGDFYVSNDNWNAAGAKERNSYIWASSNDFYEGQDNLADWLLPYERIFKTNIVLEGTANIKTNNINEARELNQVIGSALFHRAYNHYSIAQLFCKPYLEATSKTDLGIPIRLHSDIYSPSKRSSVYETYTIIVNDLKQAAYLLPVSGPTNLLYKVRPTKAAAYGMLARVYLAMADYDSALHYSNKCLGIYNQLLDYNTITSPNANIPFDPTTNPEIIFQNRLLYYSSMFSTSRLIIDSSLFGLYHDHDWRKTCFFRKVSGNNTFKGSYDGSAIFFSGIATDEIYLIRSECYARLSDIANALNDLNTLYKKRWKSQQTYSPYVANDANQAIQAILTERRKELCFRGIRWSDLRRLNSDPLYTTTLTRVVNNINYSLTPNNEKYVLPIPNSIIQLAGIQQNPR